MKVGICCAGLGAASTGDFIARSARAAERAGFSAFWVPDHIVTFETYPESQYPYSDFFVAYQDPRTAHADPLMAMAWAAAATSKIEVGTNVVVLPQRNPLLLAKQLSTLDEFSGGRVALGVGVGWAKEEFAAVGADWSQRGKRANEYIKVMHALWRQETSEFQGETVSFKGAYMYPKPVRAGGIPILVGGESDAAIKRVARLGDGWYPFHLPLEDAPTRISQLKQLTREQERDPEALRILGPIFESTPVDDMERMRDAGFTEFYLVMTGMLPLTEPELDSSLEELGNRFVGAAADW